MLTEAEEQVCLDVRRHGVVLDRHESRQELHHRDVAAEPREDRGELHADRAAAQDRHALRHLAQMDRLVARDDSLSVDLNPRHTARRRAGRDDDLFAGAQALFLAFEYVHAAVAGQTGRAFDPVDLVFLEEELDALAQAADDPILAGVHLRHVDPDGTRRKGLRGACRKGHTPVLGMLDNFQRVCVLEQRLGRDAAPQQTRATKRLLLFDNGGLESELRGADRGNVAAGAGANDNQVVFVGHEWFVSASMRKGARRPWCRGEARRPPAAAPAPGRGG